MKPRFVVVCALGLLGPLLLFFSLGTSGGEVTDFSIVQKTENLATKESLKPSTVSLVIQSKGSALLNGVILFLYGGRWHSYFVRECLPRLELYVLKCYSYPIHIFHEGATEQQRNSIKHAVPSSHVAFEDVSRFWKTLPHKISERTLEQWMHDGVQSKFQGRGYRLMCRFWAGLVWTLPSMDHYEYYWRLDTDSIITKPVALDPFRYLQQNGCEYGYNRLKGENPYVLHGLYDAFQGFALWSNLSADAYDAVRRFAIDPKTGKYWGPMFYNNFEMGSFRLKRSTVYQNLFNFLDSREPYGILKYRWGDAPIHTLGVVAVLRGKHMCNFTQDIVGYKHAAAKPGPVIQQQCSLHQ